MDEIQVGPIQAPGVSRRRFIGTGLFTGAALALVNSPFFSSVVKAAEAATPDLLHDIFSGLLAFIVPGPDAYSKAQGLTSSTPGGVDANVLEALIGTLDLSVPFTPQFSVTVNGDSFTSPDLVVPPGIAPGSRATLP